jgi:hypothetical protein
VVFSLQHKSRFHQNNEIKIVLAKHLLAEFDIILPEILPVFRWGFLHNDFKIIIEIGQIVITALVANMGNGFVGF